MEYPPPRMHISLSLRVGTLDFKVLRGGGLLVGILQATLC